MTSSAAVGRKVLAGLAKGRQRAIAAAQARSQEKAVTILYLAQIDQQNGKPERGRAGRISRKMGGTLSESQVQRILRKLSCVRIPTGHDVYNMEALCSTNR